MDVGTIRTVSAGTRAGGLGIERVAAGIAAAHDMVADVELHATRVTVNHAEPAAEVLDLAAAVSQAPTTSSRWWRR